MLYDTLSQPHFIFILSLVGFCCGFLFDLRSIFVSKVKNKFLSHLFDFFVTILCFGSLYVTNLFCHYGIVRFFPIVVFLFFLCLERFLSQKFFAKIIKKCYTLVKRKKHGAKK